MPDIIELPTLLEAVERRRARLRRSSLSHSRRGRRWRSGRRHAGERPSGRPVKSAPRKQQRNAEETSALMLRGGPARWTADIAAKSECMQQEACARLQPNGACHFHMCRDDVQRVLVPSTMMIGSYGLPHDRHPHPRLWERSHAYRGHCRWTPPCTRLAGCRRDGSDLTPLFGSHVWEISEPLLDLHLDAVNMLAH
jgi:hypothetical protein